MDKYRLYHAVEVYTGMYKTAETGGATESWTVELGAGRLGPTT